MSCSLLSHHTSSLSRDTSFVRLRQVATAPRCPTPPAQEHLWHRVSYGGDTLTPFRGTAPHLPSSRVMSPPCATKSGTIRWKMFPRKHKGKPLAPLGCAPPPATRYGLWAQVPCPITRRRHFRRRVDESTAGVTGGLFKSRGRRPVTLKRVERAAERAADEKTDVGSGEAESSPRLDVIELVLDQGGGSSVAHVSRRTEVAPSAGTKAPWREPIDRAHNLRRRMTGTTTFKTREKQPSGTSRTGRPPARRRSQVSTCTGNQSAEISMIDSPNRPLVFILSTDRNRRNGRRDDAMHHALMPSVGCHDPPTTEDCVVSTAQVAHSPANDH